jgi:hypothetical protein
VLACPVDHLGRLQQNPRELAWLDQLRSIAGPELGGWPDGMAFAVLENQVRDA